MKNIVYIISLIFLAISFFLIIEFPESGRYQLISGALFSVGLVLNITGFTLSTNEKKKNFR